MSGPRRSSSPPSSGGSPVFWSVAFEASRCFAKRARFAKRAEGERATRKCLGNHSNQPSPQKSRDRTSRAARAWQLIAGAALGLAALAKDPLGLVARSRWWRWPAPACAPGRPRRWWSPGAIVVALVVGLGWYVFAALASPGFVWYTVVDNHLLNAARARRFPDEDVPLSSLEFLAVSGLGAFPWVLGAAASVAALVRRRAWRDPAETPWVALALWATGVLAVFFALSPFKLPHYGLPAYPAIALLAVRWWMAPGRGRRGIAVHACRVRRPRRAVRRRRGGRRAALLGHRALGHRRGDAEGGGGRRGGRARHRLGGPPAACSRVSRSCSALGRPGSRWRRRGARRVWAWP